MKKHWPKKNLFITRPLALLFVTVCLLAVATQVSAQTEESRWGKDDESNRHAVVLTRRGNNGDYGTSVFSFIHNSQSLEEHRNYVDLVYNGCGHLHFNPVGGMESQVADLGENELDVEFDPDKDRFWATQSYEPQEGHVYLQKIRSNGQTMTVKYRIEEVTAREVRLTWSTVQEVSGRARASAYAGTMGQCGGRHPAR